MKTVRYATLWGFIVCTYIFGLMSISFWDEHFSKSSEHPMDLSREEAGSQVDSRDEDPLSHDTGHSEPSHSSSDSGGISDNGSSDKNSSSCTVSTGSTDSHIEDNCRANNAETLDNTQSEDNTENGDHTQSGAIIVNTEELSNSQWTTRKRNYLLKKQDVTVIDSLIDRIPVTERLNFLQGVLARIEIRKAGIHSSGGIFTRKDVRTITILSEIKDIVQTRINNIPVEWNNTTSPIISLVSVSSILQREALLWIASNEVGRGYYVILSSGSTMPTLAQIKAWQNSSGQGVVLAWSGFITNGTLAFTLKNLIANTPYILYFTAEDTNGNVITTPINIPFTTLANDTASPIISSLSVNSVAWSKNAWLMITSDRDGVGYYVVLTDGGGGAMPSSAQVKAWQNSVGQDIAFSWSGLIRKGSSQLLLRNLTTGTAYTVYFTAENTSGNMLAVPMSTSFIAPWPGPLGPSGRR